jgi:hypothetical protein
MVSLNATIQVYTGESCNRNFVEARVPMFYAESKREVVALSGRRSGEDISDRMYQYILSEYSCTAIRRSNVMRLYM